MKLCITISYLSMSNISDKNSPVMTGIVFQNGIENSPVMTRIVFYNGIEKEIMAIAFVWVITWEHSHQINHCSMVIMTTLHSL